MRIISVICTGAFQSLISVVIYPAWMTLAHLQSTVLSGSSVGEAWRSPETWSHTYTHTHTLIHTRAFSWSSSKELNKTFTTWLSLFLSRRSSPCASLACFASFPLPRPLDSLCRYQSELLSVSRPFLSLGFADDLGLNTFN